MPWRSPIRSDPIAADTDGTTVLQHSFPLAKPAEKIGTELTFLGTIEEIWRYPVSSLGGEKLTSIDIGADGIATDRNWCVADARSGQVATPEKEDRWRPTLFLQARVMGQATQIGFPDGTWRDVTDVSTDEKLTEYFGFETMVLPYQERGSPDASVRGYGVNRYEPSPVHLITTSSLEHLSDLVGNGSIDSRRFRPTIVVRTHGQMNFCEKTWLGQRLNLGPDVVLDAVEETKRCGMTLIAQPGILENPDILRTILRQNRRNLGIYSSVEKTGTITLGDSVHLDDTPA